MTDTQLVPCLLSELYHVFSAARRCYVIQFLAKTDDQSVSVRELSREITALEQNTCKEHARGEPYRNVYNALSQTHLETLANAGLVTYDQRRQRVRPTKKLEVARLLIEFNRVLYLMLKGRVIHKTGSPGS